MKTADSGMSPSLAACPSSQARSVGGADGSRSSAARLACDTDLPLSGIARRTGFRSAETLRQAFVARYGISPRDFRDRHQRAL